MRRAITAVVDFVVGDDIWVAVGVACAVIFTGVLARLGVDPWWLLPLAVPAIVAISLVRATRRQPFPRGAAPGRTRRRSTPRDLQPPSRST